jgi:plasmid stabilization system protein ParE
MRVRLHPEARAELRDARNWYLERSPLSAYTFAHTIDNAIFRIRDTPTSFPLSEHGTRKFILQHFLSIFFIE